METTYLKAPRGWRPTAPNPFLDDGSYGPAWSCFCLDGDNRRVTFCGRGPAGPFTFRLGADCPDLATRLADFLRYEVLHGRQVIVSGPDSMDVDALVRDALRDVPSSHTVRPDDPKWVVHSTTSDAWASIQSDGCLKSLAVLEKEGRNVLGLGRDELGESPDYAEYIVLGRVDEVNAEHVVSSRQKGRIVTDADLGYQPGARLYFDSHRIICVGLAVRDGLHLIKVRHKLPLVPYLAAAVSVDDLPSRRWTPHMFWQAANEVFFNGVGLGDNGR